MKKTTCEILFFVALLALIGVSSCSSIYYAPNSHNVPLHQKKGELKISGAAGPGGESSSTFFQGSYAFEDHFAAMANGQFTRGGDEVPGDLSGTGNLIELGIGYYDSLSKVVIFEAFVGAGGGRVNNVYENSSRSRIGLQSAFFQPQIGLRTKIFDLAVSGRLVVLDFQNIDIAGPLLPQDQMDIDLLGRSGANVFFEPGITVRLGYEHVKLQVQYVYSTNLSDRFISQEDINLSAGIYVSF